MKKNINKKLRMRGEEYEGYLNPKSKEKGVKKAKCAWLVV